MKEKRQEKKNSLSLKKAIDILTKYTSQISWLVSILILLIGLSFLYNNFVAAINDMGVVNALREQVAVEVVNMAKWEKINQSLEWKKQKLENNLIERNPFE